MKIEKDIFKTGSTTYYFSSRFFPKKIRDDVFKLYSFVRVADDYVDKQPPQPKKLEELEKAYQAAMADTNFESITHAWDDVDVRVVKNIVQLSRKHKFDPDWVPAFLKAMKADINPRPVKTLEASLDYVHGSAEVIGLMMVRIMGVDKNKNLRRVLHMRAVKQAHKDKKLPKRLLRNTSERVKYQITKQTPITKEDIERERQIVRKAAAMQGRAMQWINFVRDIAEDNDLKRQYIPVEDLQKVGLKDLRQETVEANPEAFSKLITLQLKRYAEWQAEAKLGLSYIPKRLRIPLQTATDMYDWTARQIAHNPLVVFSRKVKPRKRRVIADASSRIVRR